MTGVALYVRSSGAVAALALYCRRGLVDINQFVSIAQDAIHVRRVYAEPYEKDGVTVITAARVSGGGGGGTGQNKQEGQGEGGGFGVNASPAGAYVIKGDNVRWVPAVDPQKLFASVGVVIIAVAVMRGWVATRAIKAGQPARG